MQRIPLIALFALSALIFACDRGSSAGSGEFDADAGRDPGADADEEIVLVPPTPDGGADAAPDTPFVPDVPDAFSGCEAGEGCVGDPCEEGADCISGWCVDHLGGSVCTDTCVEDCPAGWSCDQVGMEPDLIFICVSLHPTLCVPCAVTANCASGTGTQVPCVSYGDEGAFCDGPCDEKDDCPEGYACQEVETVVGATLMQCVSDTGTCECTAKSIALGLSTPCAFENEHGRCDGVRICEEGGLSDYDATEPAPETCDGLDGDCDGDTDEDTCDDGNPCTDDACLGAEGCEHVALDGTECLDGDLCTQADHCCGDMYRGAGGLRRRQPMHRRRLRSPDRGLRVREQ